MMDKILWEYLEKLPEQEAAWYEWYQRLSEWHCFNTLYTHYLGVENQRAKLLECNTPCEYYCPRKVVENSPHDIMAVCPQEKADPIPLKFRDILIYSLRREAFHKALCVSLQIEQPLHKLSECRNAWYLGEHSGTAVYLTYRMTELAETISSICQQLRQVPFILMAPAMRGMTLEAQELLARNNSILLSMEAELALQPDGSFKSVRSISECIALFAHGCSQAGRNRTLPIEAYIYLAYNEK